MSAPRNRADAQRRADEIRTFQAELARLERDGIVALPPEQRAQLTAHHAGLLQTLARDFAVDRHARARQLSLGVRIAAFLGALAIAAGVFFLCWRAWGRLDTPAQAAILIGAALVTFAGTIALDALDPTGYFTKLAALIAFACFGLNLVVLGNTYNLAPSDQLLLPIGALALLFAYLCDLRLFLVAAILCLTVFTAARTAAWDGLHWIDFGRRPEAFVPAALALLALSFVPHPRFTGFAATYRAFGLLALFVAFLLMKLPDWL